MRHRFPKGHKFSTGGKREGSGRKKGVAIIGDIKAAAHTYSDEALERLAYWMRSENPKASVAASIALLDRAHGKPAQEIALNPEQNKIIVEFKS